MKKIHEILLNNLLALFANVTVAGLVAFILDNKLLGFWFFYGGMSAFLVTALVMYLLFDTR